jgi:hypothetical protein
MGQTTKILALGALLFINVIAFSQTSDTRIALVIGNKDYQENTLSLTNPINDANAMELALTKCNFKVIKLLNGDKETIERYINSFAEQLKNYDVGLFYFSGHGIEATLDGDRKNFIVPTTASSQMTNADVNYKCINSEWVQEKMVEAGRENKTNILIFDACRDNPFRKIKRSLEGEAWVRPPKVPTGVITCFSTSPNKSASDGDGSNGLYTSILLKHIRVPNITVEQVFKRVRIDMEKFGQQPQELNQLTTDFYFRTTATQPIEDSNVTKSNTAFEQLKTHAPTKELILNALSDFRYDNSEQEPTNNEAYKILQHLGVTNIDGKADYYRGRFQSDFWVAIFVKSYGKNNVYGLRFSAEKNDSGRFFGSNDSYFEIVKPK